MASQTVPIEPEFYRLQGAPGGLWDASGTFQEALGCFSVLHGVRLRKILEAFLEVSDDFQRSLHKNPFKRPLNLHDPIEMPLQPL